MEQISAKLASGNTVTASKYSISVTDQAGAPVSTIDASTVTGVRRDGTNVIASRADGSSTGFEMATIDDAGIFESGLRSLRGVAETMVKVYTNHEQYQSDAVVLASAGWSVANVTERQPPIGCLRGCVLGLMSLVWRPKPELVVTYSRKPS